MNEKEQQELFNLLEQQIEYYTDEEGQEPSNEFIQSLLMSVEYCMNSYYKAVEDGEPYGMTINDDTKPSLEHVYELGIAAVKGCVVKSKQLLKQVKDTMIPVENTAYQQTITIEIPDFFQAYQPKTGAHRIEKEPDYILAVEVDGLRGVEYMYEYLYRLLLENRFVNQFDVELVSTLLNGHHDKSRVYQINIYEIVLQNVLGLAILDRDIKSLFLNEFDLQQIATKLAKMSVAKVRIYLEELVNNLLKELGLAEKDMMTYTKEKVKDIAKHLVKAIKTDQLYNLFTIVREEIPSISDYFEGDILPDTKLREVIDEMNQMRYLRDKLQCVKEKIHHLNDLKEVLSECFAGEEYLQVFGLMLPSELEVMKRQARANLEFYNDENLLQEWERMLLDSAEEEAAATTNR